MQILSASPRRTSAQHPEESMSLLRPTCETGGPHYFLSPERCLCGAEEGSTVVKNSEYRRLVEAADRQAALAAEVARLRAALTSIRPRIAQAISYREMPSWRYAHYYSGDARTTDDFLHEVNAILDAALDTAPAEAGERV
jgi:hypothetical protein